MPLPLGRGGIAAGDDGEGLSRCVCKGPEKEAIFMRMDFSFIPVLLLYLAIPAALLYAFVRLIKYLIRYGIDYYFQKLEQYRTQHPQL